MTNRKEIYFIKYIKVIIFDIYEVLKIFKLFMIPIFPTVIHVFEFISSNVSLLHELLLLHRKQASQYGIRKLRSHSVH